MGEAEQLRKEKQKLSETMKSENDARKRENSQLKDLIDKESSTRSNEISRETSQMKDIIDKETELLNKKLQDQIKLAASLENDLGRKLEEGTGDIVELKNMV